MTAMSVAWARSLSESSTNALRVVRVAAHLAVGLLAILLGFPWMDAARRMRTIRWWSRGLLAACRMRVRVVSSDAVTVVGRGARGARLRSANLVDDAMRLDGIGAMLIMNHVSWTDIFVVNAVRPARFVAKSEIAQWPVVGLLTGRTGTVFIERGRRHAVREANHRVTQLLASGHLIAMFPEGTTGYGDRLLPFHANLLQPAIDAKVPVIVGGIRYRDRRGRPTAAPSYAGDTTLWESLVAILRAGQIVAELHLIDALDVEGLTRHELAHRARALMARRLGFDNESGEAAEEIARVVVTSSSHLRRGPAQRDTGPGTELDPRDELL